VLKADKSQPNPDVDALLEELGNSATAIPYYALFRPNQEPVHFNGVFLTPGSLLDRFADEGVTFAETAVMTSTEASQSAEGILPAPIGAAN
jgi:hypothetical protein